MEKASLDHGNAMGEAFQLIDRHGLAGELILFADFLLRLGLVTMVLAQRRRSPESRIGWILLLLGIPLLGTIIFLCWGS